jgi:hypothetical protein
MTSQPNPVLPDAERRRYPRYDYERAGFVRIGRHTIACIVLDISESGARMLLDDSYNLPGQFEIRLAAEGLHRGARLVWHTGNEAGIAFTADTVPLPPDLKWHERQALPQAELLQL